MSNVTRWSTGKKGRKCDSLCPGPAILVADERQCKYLRSMAVDGGSRRCLSALAWLFANQGILFYGRPPAKSKTPPAITSDVDQLKHAIESDSHTFTVTRSTSAFLLETSNATLNGVTTTAPGESDTFDSPVMQSRARDSINGKVTAASGKQDETADRTTIKGSNAASGVRMAARGLTQGLLPRLPVDMTTWEKNGHSYFILKYNGNALPVEGHVKQEDADLGEITRECTLTAPYVVREWLNFTGKVCWTPGE